MSDRAPITYQDISSDKISDLVGQIDTALSNQNIGPKIKSKLKRVKKAWTEQLKRNEENSAQMGDICATGHTSPRRCTNCSLRCSCHKAQRDRVIQVNHKLNELKAKVRNLLMSTRGREHRSQRPANVEQAFGNLK